MAGLADIGGVDVSGTLASGNGAVMAANAGSDYLSMINARRWHPGDGVMAS